MTETCADCGVKIEPGQGEGGYHVFQGRVLCGFCRRQYPSQDRMRDLKLEPGDEIHHA
jgi:hypothetical protein